MFFDVVRRPDGSVRAGEGPIHGRRDPHVRPGRGARAPDGPHARLRGAAAVVRRAQARAGRGGGPPHGRRATSARCCCRSSPRTVCAPCSSGCSTRSASCRPTACARCRAGTATTRRWWSWTGFTATVDYEPAESRSGLFGGNSNWRGPVWFPVNELVIESLVRYRSFLGDEFTVEYPTGSGNQVPLDEVAEGLIRRLVGLFADGTRRAPAGVRPLRDAADTTPTGMTCCGSTSISTATPGPASERRTRPAGRRSSGTSSPCAASGDRPRGNDHDDARDLTAPGATPCWRSASPCWCWRRRARPAASGSSNAAGSQPRRGRVGRRRWSPSPPCRPRPTTSPAGTCWSAWWWRRRATARPPSSRCQAGGRARARRSTCTGTIPFTVRGPGVGPARRGRATSP